MNVKFISDCFFRTIFYVFFSTYYYTYAVQLFCARLASLVVQFMLHLFRRLPLENWTPDFLHIRLVCFCSRSVVGEEVYQSKIKHTKNEQRTMFTGTPEFQFKCQSYFVKVLAQSPTQFVVHLQTYRSSQTTESFKLSL